MRTPYRHVERSPSRGVHIHYRQKVPVVCHAWLPPLRGSQCVNQHILSLPTDVWHLECFQPYRHILQRLPSCKMWRRRLTELKTWRSWIRASWYNYENNQQDPLYRLIYYSKSALCVSGDVFAHRQAHLTVFTASGSVHPSCCRLVSRMSWNWIV